MKISHQQFLIAALAGGFMREALALTLPVPSALSVVESETHETAVGDAAAFKRRRSDNVVSLGPHSLPQARGDSGHGSDQGVELYQRNLFARKGGDVHDDGHTGGTGGDTGHDGTTSDGSSDSTSNGDGQQSDTTGGLGSGDDSTTTGGLTNSAPQDPPAVVCKRDKCAYTSDGYPDKAPAPSSKDKDALAEVEKKLVHPEKNSAAAYTDRYRKEREKFKTFQWDPEEETREEQAILKKFNDNYDMVKVEQQSFDDEELNEAKALGIKDPGQLQVYSIFSKTNGVRDKKEAFEVLVSKDGQTIVSSWSFAKHDGNLNKLDSKGDPKSVGPDEYERQSDQYIEEHRLSSSNINWAFLTKITNGDKEKARAVTFWLREHIVNLGTKAQIYRSHFAMDWGLSVRGKFTYKGDSKNPEVEIKQYQALMGTANLSPVGYLFADHMQFFGGMFPLEIYTHPSSKYPNIWMKLGNPDKGDLPRVTR